MRDAESIREVVQGRPRSFKVSKKSEVHSRTTSVSLRATPSRVVSLEPDEAVKVAEYREGLLSIVKACRVS